MLGAANIFGSGSRSDEHDVSAKRFIAWRGRGVMSRYPGTSVAFLGQRLSIEAMR